ncbi:proline--tRNA ligase [Bacteriovoracaceae bacterium]|nr:proline--tRNA ligase [Bacteriovoracaceae bacterium]
MKLSQGYWQTYKEIPNDAEVPSHQLLLRAGFIQKIAAGIYTYLPFALRVIKKIENIIREEHEKINAHEVQFSIMTPGDLWKETKRWDDMGPQMLKAKDRMNRDLCFSPTNEEAVSDLFRNTVSSYKQLPLNLYQINTKFRDEIRPRFGLLRGREFLMKDAYSFHLSKDCQDKVYDDFYRCYENIFRRCGLEFIIVEADAGAMADSSNKTHEFQVVADTGEDTIVYSSEIKYASNIEKAKTKRINLDFSNDQNLAEVETKGKSTCEDVAELLGVPLTHTLKTIMVTSIVEEEETHNMILILGDDEVNEVKLKSFLKADHIIPTKESVLSELGLVVGYMGPYQLKNSLNIIIDEAVDLSATYITGANKKDYHVKGFSLKELKYEKADLRLSQESDVAEDGKTPIKFRKGIEVGHIFQLGDKYTQSMNIKILDEKGSRQSPSMGCYGIGVTRTMAAAIEQCHDENGIIWPFSIAPFQVHFCLISKTDETKKIANDLYENIKQTGIEIIFDDRKMGPGFKFKDADLLGCPIRLTLGERDFNKTGKLEIKLRKDGDGVAVSPEEVIPALQKIISENK